MSRLMRGWLPAMVLAIAATPVDAEAARLVLRNRDAGTGQGLDDATAVAPVGGNPGRTLGEQRRIVYQHAMDLWGALLRSNVDIVVDASFARLRCPANSGVLG